MILCYKIILYLAQADLTIPIIPKCQLERVQVHHEESSINEGSIFDELCDGQWQTSYDL